MPETTETYAQLVRHPRGNARHTTDLPSLHIPDVWGAETNLAKMGKAVWDALEAFRDMDNEAAEVALHEAPFQGEHTGQRLGKQVTEVWALAHDLKTHALKVDAALQPIMDLLEQREAAASSHPDHLHAVPVPVDLLRKLRAIRRGEE